MLALSQGSAINAATTITPTHDVHVISYTGTDIETINVPSPDFCGLLTLIADPNNAAVVSVGNPPNGNIVAGIGVAPGRAVILVYDPNISKWIPTR